MSHAIRAHSKFSASGSERWLNCSASVALEEKAPPEQESPWAMEGTEAHEVLEALFKIALRPQLLKLFKAAHQLKDPMVAYGLQAVNVVLETAKTLVEPEYLVEVRVHNNEIHEEMFGTVDAALAEVFGTLHVFDYKYGKGHVVDAEKNTQMIQYALGLAERYEWNFEKVVVHILQPRGGNNWHKQWELTIDELKSYRELWKKGVKRVEMGGTKPFPGSWCHWCKAKTICPALREKGVQRVQTMFEENPIQTKGTKHGKQKESAKIQSKKGQGKKESYKKKNPFT